MLGLENLPQKNDGGGGTINELITQMKGLHLHHPSKFCSGAENTPAITEDICRRKVAWTDEQAADFLTFIMVELITRRRWRGGERTILSF